MFRSSSMLRFPIQGFAKNLNLARMASQAPRIGASFHMTLPTCMGLALGVGIGGTMAFSESKPIDVDWKKWEHAILSKKDRRTLHKGVSKLAPKRDIFKNISYVIPLFRAKCDISKECMSIGQFFRWLQYHIDVTLTDPERKIWLSAFDLASNDLISLNEFISVYVLIQTMEKKNLKKRDLFKWTKANFKAIDIDGSGYLDFDEVVYWIEFAIRAGYIDNKHPSGRILSCEEIGDITLRKYDENFDGQISFEEFRSMFSDLLTGHSLEIHDPNSSLSIQNAATN